MSSNSHKSKKYDRQIRLWGEHGQISLENSSICLIGAGALGTEILKNIVLPGVGSFTIIDGERVSQEDFGVNFFVETKYLGQSRAKAATELLQELNPDVIGDYVDENIATLVENNPAFFKKFSCVIGTEISDKTLFQLDKVLYGTATSLVICRSYGMCAYLRIVVKEHTIIESRPDNYVEDLRLDQPWSELQQFCDSQVLETMTPREQSHTPWLVLLAREVTKWKNAHDGAVPSKYAEKRELKSQLEQYYKKVKVAQVAAQNTENEANTLAEGEVDDLNLQEALAAANTALQVTTVPSSVASILAEAATRSLEQLDSPFWVLCRALSEFVEKDGGGHLPVRGGLPDMTADSARFVKLQRIYRERARQHSEQVEKRVLRLLQELPSSINQQQILHRASKEADALSSAQVAHFCKHSAFLRLYGTGPLSVHEEGTCCEQLLHGLQDVESPCQGAWWLLLLLAAHRYKEESGKWPCSATVDAPGLRLSAHKVLLELGVPAAVASGLPPAPEALLQEVCRAAGAQLHCTAAWMGGVAAQEVIKLVVHQFVPVDNTLIFEGVGQTVISFTL